MSEFKLPTWLTRGITYVLVATLSSVTTFMICDQRPAQQTKLQQLEELIMTQFVGDADRTALEDGAAEGMVAATGDRWSYYISAAEYDSYTDRKTNTYVGIGVTVSTEDMTSGLEVLQLEPGGGARDAGILPGDVITGVGDVTAQQVGGEGLTELIAGDPGTIVELTVKRGEQVLTFSVERRVIQVQVAKGQLLQGNVGYVQIANFDERCTQETVAIIEELIGQGAESLLFDVRNNPGGYKYELVDLLDYLLPEGEVFRTEEYTGKVSVDTSDEKCLRMPMVVLVNENSYSAAEFFAAALREYEWAKVVGQQTSGKGYYQYTVRLIDGSAVALSMGRYFTPKGVSLAEVGGLVPDVVVEVDADMAAQIYSDLLEPMEDPQVLAALEALNN